MLKTHLFRLSLLFLLVFIFANCGDLVSDIKNRRPVVELQPNPLDFGVSSSQQSFTITNISEGSLSWRLLNGSSWLTFDDNQGRLEIEESVTIQALIDRSEIPVGGVIEVDVELELQSGERTEILSLLIDSQYEEQKWLIEGKLVDAEYDKSGDFIIAISQNPNELRKFNPLNQTFESLPLNLSPTCVSVSPNGQYCVIGHDESISYIDLESMQLIDNYSVDYEVFDVVMSPNMWAYVFPAEGQWEKIQCVDLTNGQNISSGGNQIRERTRARLHPSGDYIYGAKNGLIPSDIEKYGINNGGGVADYLYDSPYHGDHGFGGNIWFSESGDKIFTPSRNVFASTETQATDMIFIKRLEGDGFTTSVAHSTAANKVFVLSGSSNLISEADHDILRKYDYETLTMIEEITLPGFLVTHNNDDKFVRKSKGRFGFFHSDGTQFHALLEVDDSEETLNEWAIFSLAVE